MSFPRYPKYKPSGVEWLGEVPEHWAICRLKNLASQPIRNGLGAASDLAEPDLPRYIRITDIAGPRELADDTFRSLPQAIAAEAPVRLNDLLFACVGATFGKSYLHCRDIGPACYAGYLARLTPAAAVEPRFLSYWSQSAHYWAQLNAHVIQSTVQNFSASKFQVLQLTAPPLPEQRAIATFLDRETAKIDGLVAEQQRLIELLKEKRQAVISHAVTKGLDPKAPMKPSGVEWLGDVPAHWTVGVLSRFSERVVVGIAEAATHAYTETGIPILRSTNVRPNLITGEILRIDERFAEERGSKRMSAGDLVTVRTGNPGVTAVVPPELDGSQCFTMLVTTLDRKRADPWFLALWMNADAAVTFFALEGWGSAQQNISVPILKSLPVPLPPLHEQRQILDFCRTADGRMGGLIAEAESAITLLQERRSALISAAVTGQIDVRNAVAMEAA